MLPTHTFYREFVLRDKTFRVFCLEVAWCDCLPGWMSPAVKALCKVNTRLRRTRDFHGTKRTWPLFPEMPK